MDVMEAIRKRKAVRTYTDKPVPDAVVDDLLRAALAAPTGSGSQAWSIMVIRDETVRREVADLVIAGGAKYFAAMRPQRDLSDDEHREQCEAYAEQILATYRIAPVWIAVLQVPRRRRHPACLARGHLRPHARRTEGQEEEGQVGPAGPAGYSLGSMG